MLVSIVNTSNGKSVTYAFCDGTRAGGVGATRLRVKVDRKIQVQELFRAPEVVTFRRGNTRTTVTFEVWHTFASQALADAFVLGQESNIPSGGVVTFTATNANGTVAATFTLFDGEVQSHELLEQIGRTTHYQYTIVGGQIS